MAKKKDTNPVTDKAQNGKQGATNKKPLAKKQSTKKSTAAEPKAPVASGKSPAKKIAKSTGSKQIKRRQTVSRQDVTIHPAEDALHTHTASVSPAERDERVRLLAHSKWEQAGCPIGDGLEFWLAAEQEIEELQGVAIQRGF